MKINLHIERVVLDGLPIRQQQGLVAQETLQAELTRLFEQASIPSSLLSGGTVTALRADTIHYRSPIAPEQWGQQIAQAVHGSIVR